MKKIYLSIFSLIISSFAALAQDSMYFREGTQWIVEIYPDEPFKPYWTETLTLQSIPGAQSNILALYTDNPQEYYYDAHCLNIMVEGEKVYFHLVDDTCVVPSADSEGWYLMYDFGLETGETCEIYNANGMRYNNSPSVCRETLKFVGYEGTEENGSLCFMTMEDLSTGVDDIPADRGTWIKGVGDTAGLLHNGGYGRDGGGSKLIEVIYEGNIIYSQQSSGVKSIADSSDFQVMKNGLTVTVSSSALDRNCYCYSVDGNLVSVIDLAVSNNFTVPSPGFYIVRLGEMSKKIFLR